MGNFLGSTSQIQISFDFPPGVPRKPSIPTQPTKKPSQRFAIKVRTLMAKRFPARHKENRAGILFPERGIRRLNRRHVRRDVSHAGSRRYLTVRSAFVCARFGGGDSQAANRHRSHRSIHAFRVDFPFSFLFSRFLSSLIPFFCRA